MKWPPFCLSRDASNPKAHTDEVLQAFWMKHSDQAFDQDIAMQFVLDTLQIYENSLASIAREPVHQIEEIKWRDIKPRDLCDAKRAFHLGTVQATFSACA